MKTLLATLIITLTLAFPASAFTLDDIECFPDRNILIDTLIEDLDEYLIKAYRLDDNDVLEFHASEEGTWTAFLTMKNKMCVLGMGTDLNKNGEDVVMIRTSLGI